MNFLRAPECSDAFDLQSSANTAALGAAAIMGSSAS
jgi:hypothetical protein